MRRRATVLFNPVAGRGARRRLAAVIDALGQLGCIVTLRETAGPGDARTIAAGVSSAEADVLVVAGGDGTINEVLNGRAAGAPPLAVLPLGTANLLALELGLPSAPGALAAMVVSGPVKPAHPARMGERLFLLMAGAGFDADVVARLPPALKRVLGRAAYGLVALRLLAGGVAHRSHEIEIDGVPCRAASVIVAKGHYYAGRHVCAGAASIDVPEFQVCLFERTGRWQVIRYALGLVRGTLEGMAGYRVVAARRVVIRGPPGAPLQLDGDAADGLPATLDLAPETVPLVRPMAP